MLTSEVQYTAGKQKMRSSFRSLAKASVGLAARLSVRPQSANRQAAPAPTQLKPRCIAHLVDSELKEIRICRQEAIQFDPVRGGMICVACHRADLQRFEMLRYLDSSPDEDWEPGMRESLLASTWRLARDLAEGSRSIRPHQHTRGRFSARPQVG